MASEFDYDVALDAAVDAAKAASEVLMARFRPPASAPLEISYKGHADPVTDADLAADRAVAGVLKARGVPGNILSEESEERRDVSGYTWLIDPLCGTVPFSTGMPHFGVNIALAHGLQLDIGVVALPATGEMLTAVRGRGAFLNGEPLVVEEPPGDPLDVAISVGDTRPYTGRKLAIADAAGKHYSFSSAAYPLAQVILGRLHASLNASVNVHTAAAVVIARELGLKVTDEHGKDVTDLTNRDSDTLLVAWPRVHEALLAAADGS